MAIVFNSPFFICLFVLACDCMFLEHSLPCLVLGFSMCLERTSMIFVAKIAIACPRRGGCVCFDELYELAVKFMLCGKK